jgi:hypothetical protein
MPGPFSLVAGKGLERAVASPPQRRSTAREPVRTSSNEYSTLPESTRASRGEHGSAVAAGTPNEGLTDACLRNAQALPMQSIELR